MAKKITLDMLKNRFGEINKINVYANNETELYPNFHDHSFYEFMIIQKGSLIQELDGIERVLESNDLCILKPETYHKVKANANKKVVLFNFEVEIDYINEISRKMNLDIKDLFRNGNAYYMKCSDKTLSSYIDLILFALNNEKNNAQEHLTKIVEHILLSAFIAEAINTRTNLSDGLIFRALQELSSPKNFQHSLQDIFRNFPCSYESIIRAFKKNNMDNPNKIFLKNKLMYASTLLKTSNLKIIDIADLCGIMTVSYFTTAFKKEYAYTPSVYRKKYRIYN